MMERKQCASCKEYLIAVRIKDELFYLHPDIPCSGLTDAIAVSYEIEDESLQAIFEKKYGKPKYSDKEILDAIWKRKWLRWLVDKFIA